MDILIEQEIALHQYETRHNSAEIIRLLHPDFKEVGESGTSYNYTNIVDMMKDEKPSNGHIHSQDYECIPLEDTVQLLLYKSVWMDKIGVKSHFAKRVSIWVFTEGQWQIKYHQGTPCPAFRIDYNTSPSIPKSN